MRYFSICVLLALSFCSKAQYITNNAYCYASPDVFAPFVIPITKDLDDTDNILYDSLKNYTMIMIGEAHGTKESVQFMDGLIKDFTSHRKKVIAGFEVERGIMHDSVKNLTYEQLANSEFFYKDVDGRENSISANIIAKLSNDTNVSVIFFDVDSFPKKASQSYTANWRDSMMYGAMNSSIKKDANAVAITITGNIHAMIERLGTMAYHFKQDSSSAERTRNILTVNNFYESGTMLNNKGKGLQLDTIKKPNTFFLDGKIKYDNYLLLTPYPLLGDFCGILFTRKITEAAPCKN